MGNISDTTETGKSPKSASGEAGQEVSNLGGSAATAMEQSCTTPSPTCWHLHCSCGSEFTFREIGRLDPKTATLDEISEFYSLPDYDELLSEQRRRLRDHAAHLRQDELAKAFIRKKKQRAQRRQRPGGW